MSYNRRFNAKRDEGEPLIVEALEKAGWHVWTTLPVDLLLWKPAAGTSAGRAKRPTMPPAIRVWSKGQYLRLLRGSSWDEIDAKP